MSGEISILEAGLVTVQDLGRTGWRHLGVPTSGAFDRAALAFANRLVGNPESTAGLEITVGGLVLRCSRAVTVAVTGAHRPGLAHAAAVTLSAGTTVRLGAPGPLGGLRSYLAVRGGVDVEPVLGSRSTDTLSGLGPAPVAAGDRLGVGPAPPADPAEVPVGPRSPVRPRVFPGPGLDRFDPRAWSQLLGTRWVVRPDSDRVGVRLDGPPLVRVQGGELPSEPTLPGTIQVPPDGRPIVFGPDSPVTGGYPVVGVVHSDDLSSVAQLRPGDSLRLRGFASVATYD